MSDIETIGIAGAGTMGAGIALVCARAGFRTRVFDTQPSALERARDQAGAFLRKSVERGKLAAERLPQIMGLWHGSTRLEDFADCALVIEAVFESLPVKHQLFGQLDKICAPQALFASNTSTLSITGIAGGSGRADRFIGMHFCLPAQLMKLVEISPGLATSQQTFARAWDWCERLGQQPVKTQDTPGFVLNYFLIPFHNDAIRLVEQGVAEPADIDLAIKTAMGYAMGPMELLDLVGIDTQKLLCEALYDATGEPRAACPALVKRMIAAGWLGKKSGRGFHPYQDDKMFGA
ncbi:3-hydroxyacyl-CoA dehydrogenase family protein [Verminephrobacter eiseniae]|uniref:3-hydroxyacyl-CoA dehydrogenase family protein n=1 Tax=Verminephrobacter eiseniae TaxID=364317 RepID=UPI0022371004|nr:3-hydroxyacyl-CoA dehydrogenase family protein [Verminephrobacter eiseniae]MCW5261212.1 3-hydroxyacyl-CoA dehydrogenase family protein [Verminephrobacter eiseniae]